MDLNQAKPIETHVEKPDRNKKQLQRRSSAVKA